ncbi:zinc finger protein 711-like [Amphiura filiformis]|uniref:zinc finger protein 711-like n=1 Tax=Amphiura filiformis TaxID=82378 RepID=UPI003B227F7E
MEPNSVFDGDCDPRILPINSEHADSACVQLPESNTMPQGQLQETDFLLSNHQPEQETQEMTSSSSSTMLEENNEKGGEESNTESFSKVQEYLNPAYYQCHKCGKVYHQPQHLQTHIEAEHEGIKYTCELCGSTMKWKCNLRVHMEKVHNISEQVRRKPTINRKCQKCKLAFSSNRLYYRHLKSVHKESKPVQCIACTEKFEKVEDLNSHKFTHPTLVPFRCDVCRLRYSSKTGLKKHVISSKHAQKSELGNWDVCTEFDEFDQICYLCRKKFSSYSSFYMHMCFGCVAVEGATCKMCEKTFKTTIDLQNHLVDEHKIAPDVAAEKVKNVEKEALNIKCELCNKVYSCPSSLAYHMKVHKGEKNFTCDQCDHRTYKRSDMKKHKLIHSGEQPFQCPTCNKRFKSAQCRKNCMLRHLGVKSQKVQSVLEKHFF